MERPGNVALRDPHQRSRGPQPRHADPHPNRRTGAGLCRRGRVRRRDGIAGAAGGKSSRGDPMRHRRRRRHVAAPLPQTAPRVCGGEERGQGAVDRHGAPPDAVVAGAHARAAGRLARGGRVGCGRAGSRGGVGAVPACGRVAAPRVRVEPLERLSSRRVFAAQPRNIPFRVAF